MLFAGKPNYSGSQKPVYRVWPERTVQQAAPAEPRLHTFEYRGTCDPSYHDHSRISRIDLQVHPIMPFPTARGKKTPPLARASHILRILFAIFQSPSLIPSSNVEFVLGSLTVTCYLYESSKIHISFSSNRGSSVKSL